MAFLIVAIIITTCGWADAEHRNLQLQRKHAKYVAALHTNLTGMEHIVGYLDHQAMLDILDEGNDR